MTRWIDSVARRAVGGAVDAPALDAVGVEQQALDAPGGVGVADPDPLAVGGGVAQDGERRGRGRCSAGRGPGRAARCARWYAAASSPARSAPMSVRASVLVDRVDRGRPAGCARRGAVVAGWRDEQAAVGGLRRPGA